MNSPALARFRFQVVWLWHRALSRRSQNGRVLWDRMLRLVNRWLPPSRIHHPYPLRRLGVINEARAGCGKSARPDLLRGLWATMIPTQTHQKLTSRRNVAQFVEELIRFGHSRQVESSHVGKCCEVRLVALPSCDSVEVGRLVLVSNQKTT